MLLQAASVLQCFKERIGISLTPKTKKIPITFIFYYNILGHFLILTFFKGFLEKKLFLNCLLKPKTSS